jgi:hypothetical protein
MNGWFGQFSERLSPHSPPIAGGMLLAHGRDGRGVAGPVHGLSCCCAFCGSQSKSRVAKVVETQISAAHRCSCALPGRL